MDLWIAGGCFFVAIVALATPRGLALAEWVGRSFRRVCRSEAGAMALLAIVSLIIYAIPSLWHVPAPVVHDEFAYLLQAQTFAEGRLTNPPVEMARFFETFHVIQSPTYAAKFPPGPALSMVVGVWVGLPILGVWLALAGAIVAIFWMLRANLPRRWSALVALMVAVHPTIMWFSQTYWGGGVAMLGGALLGGGVLRILRNRATTQACAIAGLGIGILALSRPFEGMLYTAACGFAIAIHLFKQRAPLGVWIKWTAACAIAPMLTLAWLGYYDYRVTGRPLTMPYALHTTRYMAAPLFFWDAVPSVPTYPNEQMKMFHMRMELNEYTDQASAYFASGAFRAVHVLWGYLRPMLLSIPLVVAMGLIVRGGRGSSLLLAASLICAGVLLCHLLSCPWMRLAYMAPLVGMLFLLIGAGMRRIHAWRPDGRPLGAVLARAIVVAHVCAGIYVLIDGAARNARSEIAQRPQILNRLQASAGQQLVFVRYSRSHSPGQEWVYNAPDLPSAKVIFAHDLGVNEDNELMARYPNRTPWILDVQSGSARLMSYTAVASGAE